MGINVKRDCENLAQLNIKLLYAISSKHLKTHLPGKLIHRL